MNARRGAPWRQTLRAYECPSRLAHWLREPGSLTARCEAACERFGVRLLRHGLGKPLQGAERPLAWVREVVLVCDDRPVIFAHTVLPMAPRGRLTPWLARLGGRSLGSLLFRCKSFRRGPIEFRRLDKADALYRRAVAATGVEAPWLWARRSAHHLGMQRVLVTEVFLPGIIDF